MNALAFPHEGLRATRGVSSAARADAAYTHLKHGLLEGEYGPGHKLSVVMLTRELKCSRVPVMEAVKRLAGEGFVTIVPQVGCRVITPLAHEVRDFFALFAAAEGTVTAFAAARRTTEEVVQFKQMCTQLDTIARSAGKLSDRDPTYRRLNLMFHSFIHRLARSPVTTAIAGTMWDRSDFYIKLAFGSLYFSRTIRAAHQAIRLAVIDGDAEAARRAVAVHLHAVGDGVAAAMEKLARE